MMQPQARRHKEMHIIKVFLSFEFHDEGLTHADPKDTEHGFSWDSDNPDIKPESLRVVSILD